jgi:hypothetical protein
MINYIYDLLGIGSGLALVLVLVFLLRGSFRRFFIVLVYVAWELTATAALTVSDLLYNGSAQVTSSAQTEAQRLYARAYWTNNVVVDLLRFLLVIVLTYQATVDAPNRRLIGRLLAGVVVVVTLLPFLLFHPTFLPWPSPAFFNSTTELLSFGAAIMNLVLWAALIASNRRDPQLLKVSAGLGLVVTGEAISAGLRHFIPPGAFRSVPNLFLMLTQLGGWTIWCWTFWPAPKLRRAPTDAVTSP